MMELQHCKICNHRLTSINDTIPDNLVQIGGLYVGKEVWLKDKYYHNRLWVESSSGEGCFIPLPKIEKVIAEEFDKHF